MRTSKAIQIALLTSIQLLGGSVSYGASMKDDVFDSSYFNWKSLQLSDAIVEVRGAGNRKIAVFTDPDCGYCRKYENSLAQVDNVTIYRFLTPITETSKRKSIQIWCSGPDNATRLDNLRAIMNGERTTQALPEKACTNPIQANIRFAQAQDLYFTPSTANKDGRIAKGYLPLENLQRWLSGKPAF